MQVAILRTGDPPAHLIETYGRYDDMFARLLGPEFSTVTYDVAAGELPQHPADHGAYLVTGSSAGVYEPHPWIPPLIAFLRAAKGQAKLVGICFGHQVMAEAFGGRVVKSEKGWGAGLHTYDVTRPQAWMHDPGPFAVPVSHQDQIAVQPPESEVAAGNAFSPYGMLVYRDQPAMSLQCHPEMEPAFAKALFDSRRDRLEHADAAIASLDAPNDRERVGGWIRRFLAD
jgi:GMP synthase-like glutamine amidotransferase